MNHPHELPPQRYIDSEAEVQLHQYTVSCDQTFIQLKKECGMNGDQCTHTIMFSFFKKTHVWTDLKLHTVQPAIFMSHFRSVFSQCFNDLLESNFVDLPECVMNKDWAS